MEIIFVLFTRFWIFTRCDMVTSRKTTAAPMEKSMLHSIANKLCSSILLTIPGPDILFFSVYSNLYVHVVSIFFENKYLPLYLTTFNELNILKCTSLDTFSVSIHRGVPLRCEPDSAPRGLVNCCNWIVVLTVRSY